MESSCVQNEFRLFGIYFQKLWRQGRFLINLWSYWAVSVIIIGGIGVWLSIILEWREVKVSSILLSLITFSPPIATTACLEFLFHSEKEWFLRGPAILAGCIAGLVAVLSIVLMKYLWVAYIFAGLGVMFAYVLSWFACARDPKFTERGDASTPLGGDATNKVDGTEEGFNV